MIQPHPFHNQSIHSPSPLRGIYPGGWWLVRRCLCWTQRTWSARAGPWLPAPSVWSSSWGHYPGTSRWASDRSALVGTGLRNLWGLSAELQRAMPPVLSLCRSSVVQEKQEKKIQTYCTAHINITIHLMLERVHDIGEKKKECVHNSNLVLHISITGRGKLAKHPGYQVTSLSPNSCQWTGPNWIQQGDTLAPPPTC